jgi:hypothetical protein
LKAVVLLDLLVFPCDCEEEERAGKSSVVGGLALAFFACEPRPDDITVEKEGGFMIVLDLIIQGLSAVHVFFNLRKISTSSKTHVSFK